MISSFNKSNAAWRIFQGMILLAAGRREGMIYFEGTVDAFYTSLAPWLAFLIVDSCQIFVQSNKMIVAIKLLLSFCVLLLPAVISQVYATKWSCTPLWLRYITAATWCNWVTVLVPLLTVILILSFLPHLIHQPILMKIILVTVALYGVWLQWFIARVGLSISRWRAAVLYATILCASVLLYVIVALLPPHYVALTDVLQHHSIGVPKK